jgi:hypothetical protein
MILLNELEFDTRSDAVGEESAHGVQTRTSAGLAVFRYLVRSSLSSSAARKAARRKAVVGLLDQAREPFACINELLAICSSAGGMDRLDTAVDILSATGELVLRYARNYLIRDVQQWNPYSSRAYEPNDDHWYILLRAVARCAAPEAARLRMICACKHAAQRGIVEAVVEALGDLASAAAREVLRDFSTTHSDPFIRNLAKEVLANVEQ